MSASRVLSESWRDLPRIAEEVKYRPRTFAARLGLSLRSAQRQCRKTFDMSLRELLDRLWLTKSEALLAPDRLAKEVFTVAGHNSCSAFCRHFKRAARTSVTEWKRAQRRRS